MKYRCIQGFTLIEISIVLVIIGLVTGAVIAGQTLIAQSKIKSTLSLMQEVTAAVNTFKQKYDQLPGDINNATTYWGTNSNPDCAGIRIGTQTCNGDGAGTLETTSVGQESALFWQHLENAGLVSQHFVGNIGVSGYLEGNEMPTSINGVFLTVDEVVSGHLDPGIITSRKHNFILGGPNAEDNLSYEPFITPTDAMILDQKIDDAKPSTGLVSTDVGFYDNTRCRTSASPPSYDISHPDNTCALYILTDF